MTSINENQPQPDSEESPLHTEELQDIIAAPPGLANTLGNSGIFFCNCCCYIYIDIYQIPGYCEMPAINQFTNCFKGNNIKFKWAFN